MELEPCEIGLVESVGQSTTLLQESPFMRTTGAQALLSILADSGVRFAFGNPGTTELPLMDALVGQDRIRYILGLQEVPVVAMADGYAQASGGIGFVNLHISCGLGNGMGMIYNAWRSGTPLVITAGQQDRRLAFDEPVLWSDMARVVRPWTKWAVEVNRIGDLPNAVRRAVQTALAPPAGPVFLSLPMDMLWEEADLDCTPSCSLDVRVRPPEAALRQAADVLAKAKNPVILAGSRVQEAGAVPELVALAELWGALVLCEAATTHGRLAFPSHHPLYGQMLPLGAREVHERLRGHDVALAVGMDVLRMYIFEEPARPIPEHLPLVHVDDSAWPLGKNVPAGVSVLGHIQPALEELSTLLGERMKPADVAAARTRACDIGRQHRAEREALVHRIDALRGQSPMPSLVFMESLARVLPANAAVIDEAVTSSNSLFERLGVIRDPSGYFGHRGWALGWGLGMAIGVKLAWPDRPVLALLGDGAAMYGIQGLWTAAHYRLPVTFVIANNSQYQILKMGARQLGLPHASQGRFLAMDLVDPPLDFVKLAESMGVPARRASTPDELAALVSDGLSASEPRLVEAAVGR
jgi:benzoylformate decarboxylase